MMHILFINTLDKLDILKDSSLMMALTFKQAGAATYLLFEKDFYYQNNAEKTFRVYDFEGSFKEGSYYLNDFSLLSERTVTLDASMTLHMRIDPPFDTRYLMYLWILQTFKKTGVRIINDPAFVTLNNEKLVAYEGPSAMPTYIGTSFDKFYQFIQDELAKNHEYIIIKPLDLYQGLGVEKLKLADFNKTKWQKKFADKIFALKGPLVAQEYIPSVEKGEVRAIFFHGKELGSILKIPPAGGFLANIASGATYREVQLTPEQRELCEKFCAKVGLEEVPWIAFDILGNIISEANITCPGLLVEVSTALGKNLAKDILQGI